MVVKILFLIEQRLLAHGKMLLIFRKELLGMYLWHLVGVMITIISTPYDKTPILK